MLLRGLARITLIPPVGNFIGDRIRFRVDFAIPAASRPGLRHANLGQSSLLTQTTGNDLSNASSCFRLVSVSK